MHVWYSIVYLIFSDKCSTEWNRRFRSRAFLILVFDKMSWHLSFNTENSLCIKATYQLPGTRSHQQCKPGTKCLGARFGKWELQASFSLMLCTACVPEHRLVGITCKVISNMVLTWHELLSSWLGSALLYFDDNFSFQLHETTWMGKCDEKSDFEGGKSVGIGWKDRVWTGPPLITTPRIRANGSFQAPFIFISSNNQTIIALVQDNATTQHQPPPHDWYRKLRAIRSRKSHTTPHPIVALLYAMPVTLSKASKSELSVTFVGKANFN